MPNPSQPVARVTTRSKNVDQHPGSVVAPKRRRSKAEKARDDELAGLAIKKVQEKKKEDIARVARLEDAMAVDDHNAENAHPRYAAAVAPESESELTPPESEPQASDFEELESHAEEPSKKKGAPAKADKSAPYDAKGKSIHNNRLTKEIPQATRGTGEKKRKVVEVVKAGTKSRQTSAAINIESDEEEESDTPGIAHKTIQNVPKASRTKTQATSMKKSAVAIAAVEDIPTDVEDSVPKKKRRGLTRTYAMIRESEPQDTDGDYDPANPDERGEATSVSARLGVVEISDSDETPKKKKKVPKALMREAINAKREATSGKRKEVITSTSTFTQPSKPGGLVKNWCATVAKEANPAFKIKREGPGSLAGSAHTATSTTVQSKARTTASSTAVLVKTEKSTATAKSGITSGFGGFEDEDETDERDHALSSPIKGKNKRLDSAAIVKVEQTEPLVKGKRSKYTNADLPAGSQEHNVWRGKVVPTFIQYMSTDENIWGTDDDVAADTMQRIWDFIYGAKIPQKIMLGGPILSVADQRLCETRGAFGSAGLMIINTFFAASGLNMDKERRMVAIEQLENYTFLYSTVKMKRNGEVLCKGLFHGPLVLQVFAVHLTAVSGAVTVPRLGHPDNAKGALALSSAAIERGFTLWRDGFISMDSLKSAPKSGSGIIKARNESTGKTSGKSTDFTQANWSSITADYYSSIVANFKKAGKFESLVEEAGAFVQAKNSQRDLKSEPDDAIPRGERALLLEESGDEDEESGDDDEENVG